MAPVRMPRAAPDALHRELAHERIQSARRINVLRLWGVSAFFGLFFVLGTLVGLAAWTGNHDLFAAYWLISVALFWASRRWAPIARFASLAVALVDMPMVFLVQEATLATSPSASGVAGFTVGVYVLLVILAALSLENWFIWFTAAIGAVLEVVLQQLAGVGAGAMVATVLLLALAAGGCSYARTRLVEMVGRVEQDIAEQQRVERALRQAERMASLGTLAASVAHEINTPLTYVITNLGLLAERLPESGGDGGSPVPARLAARLTELEQDLAQACEAVENIKARFISRLPSELRHEFNNRQVPVIVRLSLVAEDLALLAKEARKPGSAPGGSLDEIDRLLDQARQGAERVRTIVRDLKTFSRPDEDSVGLVDPRAVLESSINIAASVIRHRARLRTEFSTVPFVKATEPRLGQVFINLLVNAAQAIPEGAVESNEICVVTRTDAERRAVIEVRDTGSGIAPEDLGRLFAPFFTTKPAGEGTGLGLSICHSIVTALGGELSAESQLGKGSTFRVVLPPGAPPVDAATPTVSADRVSSAASAPSSAGRARILVIDDDAGIGDAVRQSLAGEHDVMVLTSPSDALKRVAEGERFDLILCDLMMPTMTGMDLYGELARIKPTQAARMGFLTGGAFTPRAQEFLADVPNPRLEKPFDPKELRSFVRQHVRRW